MMVEVRGRRLYFIDEDPDPVWVDKVVDRLTVEFDSGSYRKSSSMTIIKPERGFYTIKRQAFNRPCPGILTLIAAKLRGRAP